MNKDLKHFIDYDAKIVQPMISKTNDFLLLIKELLKQII